MDDADAVGETVMLSHTAGSTDTDYTFFATEQATGHVTDNDPPNLSMEATRLTG